MSKFLFFLALNGEAYRISKGELMMPSFSVSGPVEDALLGTFYKDEHGGLWTVVAQDDREGIAAESNSITFGAVNDQGEFTRSMAHNPNHAQILSSAGIIVDERVTLVAPGTIFSGKYKVSEDHKWVGI
jgi:hypothetical protein